MKLNIDFPRNAVTEMLLKQEKIPCLVKVSEIFEIFFGNDPGMCWACARVGSRAI